MDSTKVRIFLNSECSLYAMFLTFLESLDREVDMAYVQNYANVRRLSLAGPPI